MHDGWPRIQDKYVSGKPDLNKLRADAFSPKSIEFLDVERKGQKNCFR